MNELLSKRRLHLKRSFYTFYLRYKSRRLKKELSNNFTLYNLAIDALRYVQQEHDRIVLEYHKVSRELENEDSHREGRPR